MKCGPERVIMSRPDREVWRSFRDYFLETVFCLRVDLGRPLVGQASCDVTLTSRRQGRVQSNAIAEVTSLVMITDTH